MDVDRIGREWILWPEELADRLSPEDKRRLLGGERITLGRTGEKGAYDTELALVPCTLLGRECRVLMNASLQGRLMRWAGEEGEVQLPLVNRNYPELTEEAMETLIAGGEYTLERRNGSRVRLFMQWLNGSGWVRLNPRSWDEEARAHSEARRRAFFQRLEQAFACRLKLMPSGLAKYFESGCDRQLLPPPRGEATGGEKKNFSADAGNRWEEAVVRYLKGRFDAAGQDDALAQLTELFRNPGRNGENRCSGTGQSGAADGALFLHHPVVFLPGDVRALLPIDGGEETWPLPDGVYWSKIEPDLLRCKPGEDGVLELAVIDVKLAQTPHISHIMQVCLYISLLETYLHRKCDGEETSKEGRVFRCGTLRLRVDRQSAWLWNGIDALRQEVEHPAPLPLEELQKLWFPIRPQSAQPYLNDFFRRDLPRICGALPQGAQGMCFCTGNQCANCGWRDACLEWGRRSSSVQLIPGLSRNAQMFLMDRAREVSRQRGDNALFRSLLTYDGILKAGQAFTDQLRGNSEWEQLLESQKFLPLRGNRSRKTSLLELRKSLRAGGQAQLKLQIRSISLPAGQDVGVMITCHTGLDQRGERIWYAGGIQLASMCALPVLQPYTGTWVAAQLSSGSDVGAQLLESLCQILTGLVRLNEEQAARRRRPFSLHGYVYNSFEFDALRDLALRFLDSEEHGESARTVLFWMLGNSIGDRAADLTEEHPAEITRLPVSILGDEIRSLYVIPAEIDQGFADVMKAFGLGGDPDFAAAAAVSGSGRLSPEDFYADENGNMACTERERLEAFLRSRLSLLKKLLRLLQEHNQHSSFVIPKKLEPFFLANADDNPGEVSKLLFRSVYEEYLQKIEADRVRWQNETRYVAAGKLLRLRSIRIEPAAAGRKTSSAAVTFEGGEPAWMKNPVITFSEFLNDGSTEEKRLNTLGFCYDCGALLDGDEPEDEAENEAEAETEAETEAEAAAADDQAHRRMQMRFWKLTRSYEKRPLTENEIAVLEAMDFRGENETLAPGDKQLLFLYDSYPENLCQNEQSFLCGHGADLSGLLHLREELPAAQEPGAAEGYGRLGARHDFLQRGGALDPAALAAYGQLGGFSFSDSQREAFDHVAQNTFTLLQGPPGTGKTDFIARTVIALSRAFLEGGYDKTSPGELDENGRWLRILICANSNKAIQNALDKTEEKLGWCGEETAERIKVKKVGKKNSARYPDPKAQRDNGENRRVLVLGATSWDCIRQPAGVGENTEEVAYDLVIIDEASQLSVSQALMALERGTSGSHVLIVGDQQQLPTIVRGKYRTQDPRFNLFSSVFDLYLDQAKRIGCQLTLLENYRMSEAISHYSASEIYDPELPKGKYFRAPTREIRSRRLALKDGWEEGLTPEEKFVLDPRHNFVLIVLRGGNPQALARKEVELAVRCAMLLQDKCAQDIRDGNGEVTKASVKRFWGTDSGQNGDQTPQLGIVCPTHAQKKEIRNELREKMNDWLGQGPDDPRRLTGKEFLIGTADALQGQERESVIISYGVSDTARASQLEGFIYDRRRLNVALTRGRRKVVLILTGALTEHPIELLSRTDQDLLSGVSFLCGLEYALKAPSFREKKIETGCFFTEERAAEDGGVSVSIYGHGYVENGEEGR